MEELLNSDMIEEIITLMVTLLTGALVLVRKHRKAKKAAQEAAVIELAEAMEREEQRKKRE